MAALAPSPGRRIAWMVAATGVGTAELLVHNVSAVLAASVAAVWVAYLALAAPSRRSVVWVLAAGATAAGLTAFFWLPALAETYAVRVDMVRIGALDYHVWLLDPGGDTPGQRSPANRQTLPGPFDTHLRYPHQLSVAPKISLAQAGLGALALAALAAAVAGQVHARSQAPLVPGPSPLEGEGNRAPPWTTTPPLPLRERGQGGEGHRRALALLPLLTVAAGCWFLTFTVSEPVWRHVPGLAFLQFPWRLLGPLSLCLAIAGAGALAWPVAALEARWPRWGRRVGWLLVALAGAAVVGNSGGGQEFLSVEARRPAFDVRTEVADETDRYGPVTTSGGEFTPREMRIAEYEQGQRRDRVVFEHLYPEHDWLGGMVHPLAGDLRLLGWSSGPLWLGVRVANDAGQPGRLAIRQFRFPGWRAWVDGRPAPVEAAAYVPEQQAALGFITVAVPPGEHTVSLAFGPTKWRLAGLALTVAAALGAASALAWALRRVCRWPRTPLAAGWLAVAGVAGALAWRGVRPMLPAYAAAPVPPAQAMGGVWQAAGPDARLLVNVAEAVRAGQAQVNSPRGAATGPGTFVDVRQLTVTDQNGNRGAAGTSRREWLYLHPPSDVSVDVALPGGREVWFQAALALDPGVWGAPTGDGVRFQALLSRPAAGASDPPPETLVDLEVNPRARGEDRRWIPVDADLSSWAGATVRLTLRTAPRADLDNDWAGWGNPVVVVRESARPRPRATARVAVLPPPIGLAAGGRVAALPPTGLAAGDAARWR